MKVLLNAHLSTQIAVKHLLFTLLLGIHRQDASVGCLKYSSYKKYKFMCVSQTLENHFDTLEISCFRAKLSGKQLF